MRRSCAGRAELHAAQCPSEERPGSTNLQFSGSARVTHMSNVPKAQFFGYFRRRLKNLKLIKDQFGEAVEPEGNILAGAELDALAKYWAKHSKRPEKPAGRRMAEFLAAHANTVIWTKCSHTDLRERAKSKLDPRQRAALQRCLSGIPSEDATHDASVLSWTIDPDFGTLQHDGLLNSTGIPVEFLEKSRYGEILYRLYRCAWIHDLTPDDHLNTDSSHPLTLLAESQGSGPPQPYYAARNHVRGLVIPQPFILSTLEEAINRFEQSVPNGTSFPQ